MGWLDKMKKKKNANTEDDVAVDTEKILDEEFGAEVTEESADFLVEEPVSEINTEYCAEPACEADAESDAILSESFVCIKAVSDERNKEICDRFVAGGIEGYARGSFDAAMLDELTYDEFCRVYNTVEWYVLNIAPELRREAVGYKTYLRILLLDRLRRMPLYTVLSGATSLPYMSEDGAMWLLTDAVLAQKVAKSMGEDMLSAAEILPHEFDGFFGRCYCAGFNTVKLNLRDSLPLGEICPSALNTDFGIIAPYACVAMMKYKQLLAELSDAAQREGRGFTAEERNELAQLSSSASEALCNSVLLLPLNTRNDQAGEVVVPVYTLEDGRKYVALFTDADALAAYYKKPMASMGLANQLRERYLETADVDIIKGIIVNPSREEYVLTKNMLAKIFAQA